MTDLNQYRVAWTGAAGLPGVSTFYNTGAVPGFLTALRAFFEAVKTSIPNTITITYPSSGNVIDDTTGQVKAAWASTAPAPTVCSATGTYQAPTGACINWNTGLFVGGRRLRGKTFLVPLANGAFGSDGKLVPANVTAFTTAANTLASSATGFVVYSSSKHVNGAVTTGYAAPISAVLRSRRD